MRKWVLCGLGIKKPNRNYEQKTIMNEGTFKYVIEAKTQEIRLKEEIVEEFTSGRMSRDKLKALEEAEKFNTAAQGLSESCPEWKPHKEIHEEYHEELKELEKKMEEVNAGENKQPHTTDKEPQYMGREKAAPLDEKILPYSKKALEVVVVQTGDGGIKIGMPMSKDLMEAKFPKSAMGARSVWRGSEEVVVESWNVQMGMCLMDEYSSEKTSRDCLKLLEVEKEFQPGGQRLHGEQTEWKPDIEFPEEITSASKEENSLPDKVLQDS